MEKMILENAAAGLADMILEQSGKICQRMQESGCDVVDVVEMRRAGREAASVFESLYDRAMAHRQNTATGYEAPRSNSEERIAMRRMSETINRTRNIHNLRKYA